jgi:3-hydroxyacyl-CoA dehydrogenase/3a,7a,12a-trihydroxy-5b-cholest-24-enoyl-CoA hydratase
MPDELTETAHCLNTWVSQQVSYNTRDLLTYALGIGCGVNERQFTYELDGNFAAFPTYAVVLQFKGTDQDVVSFPSPAMTAGPEMPQLHGVRTGLDGERHIERLAPLPPGGAKLTMRSRLIGVHKRGSGALVETETLISDSAGTDLYRITSGAFLVGATGFKESGVTHSTKVQQPTRAPDAVEEMPVSEGQALVYRLSGDYNPLHADPEFATMSGFKRPILHGLCSLGFSARAVLNRFGGGDPGRFRDIRLRFSSPVLPGQTLRVEMWDEGGGRIVFRSVVKETGKVCISNSSVQLVGGSKL